MGLVNVAAFAVVFADAKLYADMGLQVVYVGLCLYGWWAWLHGGANHGELAVARTPVATWGTLAGIAVAATCALGFGLHRLTDASLPFLDAATASTSLVAQWMQTRKLIENWLVWIAVDVVYVGMYVLKGLWLTAGLYVVFIALAVVGWTLWQQTLATERHEAAA